MKRSKIDNSARGKHRNRLDEPQMQVVTSGLAGRSSDLVHALEMVTIDDRVTLPLAKWEC